MIVKNNEYMIDKSSPKERVLHMKLTDELIKKIDAAETMEEKKCILSDNGIKLSDEVLENVVGGNGTALDLSEIDWSKIEW